MAFMVLNFCVHNRLYFFLGPMLEFIDHEERTELE